MKALAAVLVVALSAPSWAADDAPLVSPEVPAVGGTLSEEALCLTPEVQLALAKKLEADKAALASLKADAGKVQPLPIVITAILAIGAGFAIGFGVKAATAPKP